MDNDLYAPYKLSIDLKANGFDGPCLGRWKPESADRFEIYDADQEGYYNSENEEFVMCGAPIWEQVTNWFDDVHKIRIDLKHADSNGSYTFTIWIWNFDNTIGKWERFGFALSYFTRFERNTKAVEEALKLIISATHKQK